ncbi:hypothetical protein [Micromonospora coerulea]|uniref:hypothetical protein n=1 Tax=Micromonospora coerulea TaxID=47856 RepID=UPI0031F8B95E
MARFGFVPMTALALLFAPAAVCGGIALDPGRDLPEALFLWLWKLLLIVLFGGGALWLLLAALSRRVALRVDRDGVTLATPSFLRWWGNRADIAVPWRDIAAVVLFYQYVRWPARILYLGLQLHPSASAPAGAARAGSFEHWSLERFLPHVPVEASSVSRQVNGWRLDRRRLVAAVRTYAPDVPVIELDEQGSPRDLRLAYPEI